MKLGILVFIIVLFATSSFAQNMVLRDTLGNTVTLTTTPCTATPWTAKWRKANFFYQSKNYEACWIIQNRMVVVFDEDGDVSTFPIRAFKEELGT